MSNKQIIHDNVLSVTIEEFLKSKYEYHRNVLLEINHMQQLLEEARPRKDEFPTFSDEDGVVEIMPESSTEIYCEILVCDHDNN